MNLIAGLLPAGYLPALERIWKKHPEEVRLGTGRPVRVLAAGREEAIFPPLTQSQLEDVLQRACRFSAYAHQDTLRQGYVTLEGGHRLGVCGFGVVQQGVVHTIRSPTSLVLRIARAVLGCAEGLFPALTDSTLILGPPGAGKTTLLRDAVRLLSDQGRLRVGLADERGEVSASTGQGAGLEVGHRTDVMVNVPKAEAVMMLLRTMSPQWIALDEITAPEDIEALDRAAYCGVKLLATAHGDSLSDLTRRPLYHKLLARGVFSQVVLLSPDKSYQIHSLLGEHKRMEEMP